MDGLWGITFGYGVALGDANGLQFAARPNSEEVGVFGRLTVTSVPKPAAVLMRLAGLLAQRLRRRA